MSILEEAKIEGKLEGSRETLLDILEQTKPDVRERYRGPVISAESLESLEKLKHQILRAAFA